MESIIKEDIKDNGITIGRLAEEFGISEDRITAMNNSPESTPLGRIINTYDYIGKVPSKLINSISNNKPALDKLELSAEDFLFDRRDIESIINECSEASEACMGIVNAFESGYRYPLIYITGSEACGKSSMVENLLGKELMFTDRKSERGYRNLLFMSDKHSGIEYNYPFGEYPYRIMSSEFILDLLTRRCKKDEMEQILEPISKIGMQRPYSYVIYSDSPFLEATNIICCSSMIPPPDTSDNTSAAETDAQIIGMSDIIVIMLDPNFANSSKLADIMQYARLRWNKDISDHVIFVIARSDRYQCDEIKDLKREYSDIIGDMLKVYSSERDRFFDNISDMIFSYSSIYKKNNKESKTDAMYNTAFYKKLQNMVSLSLDNEKRRDDLREVLERENIFLSSKNVLSNETASNLKTDIKGIFSQAEICFENDFQAEYDKIVSSENILQLIERYDITRADKSKLISIVNSQLNNAIVMSASKTFFTIEGRVRRTNYDVGDTNLISILTTCITNTNADIVYKFGCEKDKREFRKAIMQRSDHDSLKAMQRMLAGGTLAAGVAATMVLSVFTPIIAGAAAADTVAYYAQTNFKKNTAKKIVSLYEKHGIKDSLSQKFITRYFVTLENKLKEIIDSFAFQGDEQAIELTEKILEVIGS